MQLNYNSSILITIIKSGPIHRRPCWSPLTIHLMGEQELKVLPGVELLPPPRAFASPNEPFQ